MNHLHGILQNPIKEEQAQGNVRTIDLIIYKVNSKYGAPLGRANIGTKPTDPKIRVYDCAVPMDSDGAYDKGGAYWGHGAQLRVSYTKDLSYVEFYRGARVRTINRPS